MVSGFFWSRVRRARVLRASGGFWGIALTPTCNVTISWPVRSNSDHSLEATYETTQTSGARVCKIRP